jgi:hypothetical protein
MAPAAADILIFVEDPGAANYVLGLAECLQASGRKTVLVSTGAATDYLIGKEQQSLIVTAGHDAAGLLKKYKPKLVAVGTSENIDSVGLALIDAAQASDIPTLGLVDSSTNLAYRFRGRSSNPLRWCPEKVIVPDAASRDQYVALGLSDSRIAVCGHPHWDHVRSERNQLWSEDRAALRRSLFGPSLDERRAIVFSAEISDGLQPEQFQFAPDYTLEGDGSHRGRTEIVVAEFLSGIAPFRNDVHLVLRLHPKNQPSDLLRYRSEFDTISQAGNSLPLLYAADVVVGMTSMLMLEASLMGLPTLAILPRIQESLWLPTIAAGVTPVATTRQAVSEQIESMLVRPQAPDPSVLNAAFPPGSMKRVIEVVETLFK